MTFRTMGYRLFLDVCLSTRHLAIMALPTCGAIFLHSWVWLPPRSSWLFTAAWFFAMVRGTVFCLFTLLCIFPLFVELIAVVLIPIHLVFLIIYFYSFFFGFLLHCWVCRSATDFWSPNWHTTNIPPWLMSFGWHLGIRRRVLRHFLITGKNSFFSSSPS